jgi:hypothetical protein
LYRQGLLNRTLVTQEIIARIDKWDRVQLKSVCTVNETVTRMKRQPTEWEEIFVGYSSGMGFIYKIYKNSNN